MEYSFFSNVPYFAMKIDCAVFFITIVKNSKKKILLIFDRRVFFQNIFFSDIINCFNNKKFIIVNFI